MSTRIVKMQVLQNQGLNVTALRIEEPIAVHTELGHQLMRPPGLRDPKRRAPDWLGP
jgi:hypothetical protein